MKTVIVAISGKQGSGKTTLASKLHQWAIPHFEQVRHWKFANPLYAMEKAIAKTMEEYGRPIKTPDGRLLQLLGTEWGRETLGPNVWAEILEGRILALTKPDSHSFIVVDDARFDNELEVFKRLKDAGYKVLTVRLEAPEEARKVRAEKWRDRTNHPSEVGLDHRVMDFDLVLNTHELDEAGTIKEVWRAVDRLVVDRPVPAQGEAQ